jgi:hypothetical protein
MHIRMYVRIYVRYLLNSLLAVAAELKVKMAREEGLRTHHREFSVHFKKVHS